MAEGLERERGSCGWNLLLLFVTQSRLTLRGHVGCNPLGSSLCGILQARILEWVTISFSRESAGPRD